MINSIELVASNATIFWLPSPSSLIKNGDTFSTSFHKFAQLIVSPSKTIAGWPAYF
jgi:hypothetical protein